MTDSVVDPGPSAFASLMTLTRVDDDRFVAPRAPEGGERLFGGQFIAQALAAAQLCTDSDRLVHSLHCYFLRPGATDEPLTVVVERTRDGRSFSSRQVQMFQGDRELFRVLLSFHVPEPGKRYEPRLDSDVPGPGDVELTFAEYSHRLETNPDNPWTGHLRPMEIRYINPPEGATGPPITEPQRMWMRVNGPLPDDPALHVAGLGYLADSTLVDHVALPHGIRWQSPLLTGTSLDHAMWFHRPARCDEWLLYDQTVEQTGAARGLATGRFYTRAGDLVATCAQEGLMRIASTPPS